MLIHISFLKIPLCYKVLIEIVKVKVDVHPVSEKMKNPKRRNFLTFIKERRSFLEHYSKRGENFDILPSEHIVLTLVSIYRSDLKGNRCI